MMFKRISLAGSDELFRVTQREEEEVPAAVDRLADVKPDLTALPDLPAPVSEKVYYQYNLSEEQVQTLVDAVQKLKYPHLIKQTTKLSIDEFERLDALRVVLIEGLE
jgi:hypothetical protein